MGSNLVYLYICYVFLYINSHSTIILCSVFPNSEFLIVNGFFFPYIGFSFKHVYFVFLCFIFLLPLFYLLTDLVKHHFVYIMDTV